MTRLRRPQFYVLSVMLPLFALAGIACAVAASSAPPPPAAAAPTEVPDSSTAPPSEPPPPSAGTPYDPLPGTPPVSTPAPPPAAERLPHPGQRPSLTPEEEIERRREIGYQTAPRRIHVAGRDLELPQDVFVEYWIATAVCVVGGPCPEAPYYVIRRGNSTIMVSVRSGTLRDEKIAPGEEGAFDFLKAALTSE